MPRLLRGVFAALLITLVSLGLLEVLLRGVGPSLGGQLGAVARTIVTGSPYADDWQPAWRENHDHYYTLRPGLRDVLQYGSPSVAFRLTTDKLWDDGLPPDQGIGFRNPPVDYRVDIVVTGDSFGFCFTALADCWVNQLADRHGLGAVNLGTPVTGSLSHARMLADFAAALRPPLVIWQFFGNDFNDDYALLRWRGDIPPLPDEVTDAPNTAAGSWLTQNLVTAALFELFTTGRWSGLPGSDPTFEAQYRAQYPDGTPFLFGKPYELGALDMTRAVNRYGIQTTRQALADAQALVDSWGGRLVVVAIPTREEVYSPITAPLMGAQAVERLAQPRVMLAEICAELALTCYDPTEALRALAVNGPALYYPDDMHLNAAGNAALTDLLATWLTENALLPITTTSQAGS
jgi:lysophospholipase L1-like esterase